MNTKILILILSFLAIVMYGQEKTYTYYIQQLDSIKKEYSVNDNFYFNYSNTEFFRKFFKENNLSTNEKQFLIDTINYFYIQEQYIGLYYVAKELLTNMYLNFTEEELQQYIIYLLVNNTFYTDTQCKCSLGHLLNYSTNNTKKRLKEIMQLSLNEKEKSIQARIQEVDYKKREMKSWENIVAKIMNTTKRKGKKNYDFLMDSLKKDYINQRLNEWFNHPNYKPITSDCILYIGSMGDTSFMSYLEEYRIKYPQKKTCTYALAKLGVQKYIDDIFKNEDNIQWDYLGTKESLLRWLTISRDWNKWISLGSKSSLPEPVVSLWRAQNYIKNKIPKEVKLRYMEIEDFCLPGWKKCDSVKIEASKLVLQKLDRLYQWFFDNKNNLELPPAKDSF